ncbi:hypothetical protein [Formosa maritima]|uniref:Uncharacterized protein n=1 Tax=Formosa maritima TaxID=2592046 RepID=A0A5D0FZ87_9FLAO|nr:hypothetical protein [Formosa maritima]TYA52193.1 hypothetical protein FVF61_12665 [Formosa maritima]
MKTVKELLQNISELIRDIETNYPELYQYLDENPVTIPNMQHPKVTTEELENYLETLNDLLDKYKKEHKK